MARINILRLIVLFNFCFGADGYYHYFTNECFFSSFELKDLELLITYHYNKNPYIRFNSTVGEYVGYTDLGVYNAERWNKDPNILAQARAELERYCRNNVQNEINVVMTKAVTPTVELMSEQKASGSHPARLMCSAYNFYPKLIKVSWLRDGKPVTTDVTATEEMADGDWYYQVHTHLEYTPKSGEKISCVVEHASFKTPMIYDWDPSVPESERNKIAIGASGLVLGIILSAAGFIYYKKKSSGRILVPS